MLVACFVVDYGAVVLVAGVVVITVVVDVAGGVVVDIVGGLVVGDAGGCWFRCCKC